MGFEDIVKFVVRPKQVGLIKISEQSKIILPRQNIFEIIMFFTKKWLYKEGMRVSTLWIFIECTLIDQGWPN